jgi:hypothetical protein
MKEIWRTLSSNEKPTVLLESIGTKDKTIMGRIGNWFQGIGTAGGKVKWENVFNFGNEEMERRRGN